MTFDGSEVEVLLWDEGADYTFSSNELGHSFLNILGTGVSVGYVWPDDNEIGWSLDSSDLIVYKDGEYYSTLESETVESFVADLLEISRA